MTPKPNRICKTCRHLVACKRTRKACLHFQDIDLFAIEWKEDI